MFLHEIFVFEIAFPAKFLRAVVALLDWVVVGAFKKLDWKKRNMLRGTHQWLLHQSHLEV